MVTIDNDARRATLVRHFGYVGGSDTALAHELYHADAVLEFPQSGERFEGVDNFREWREKYPGDVQMRTRRIVGSGDVWIGEHSVSYDGGPWMLGVSIHEFRGGRLARERIYVTEPWDAPAWRAPWRSPTIADRVFTSRLVAPCGSTSAAVATVSGGAAILDPVATETSGMPGAATPCGVRCSTGVG